uniref:Oxysterol-binding protein n=1 Tax=Esox lucius TaxID=8010 RepID=A0A3P8ZQY9_ESOLU
MESFQNPYGSPLNRSQSLMSGLEKTPPTCNKPTHSRSSSTASSRHSRCLLRGFSRLQNIKDWEVMDDLQVDMTSGDNPQDMPVPGICEGYLLKRRKWPLKGWHKRYFVLETGILRYSKTQQDITRGKLHGSLDVSLAVMSINKKSNRIDLDAGDILYHIKVCHLFNLILANLRYTLYIVQYLHKLLVILAELNRCQLDLSELNRLVQKLQMLEGGQQAFSNGELQRIISMQVCGSEAQKPNPLWPPDTDNLCPPENISHSKLGQSIDTWCGFCGCRLSLVQDLKPRKLDSSLSWICFSAMVSARAHTHTHAHACTLYPASNKIFLFSQKTLDLSFVRPPASATREYRASISKAPSSAVPKNTGRRCTLPARCPDNAHVGLMQILYNNIGKDLSRVSMPAALNEPVNLIQRLCEELEYSELLDTANNTQDPYQRMVYIGAFAISGYATAHYRNRYKPFNPLLGETYECHREDKGFRFISEQVCHHPPISACHADSDNFSLWQDQRWKNKFWGKSLEIMPTGMVNVTLPRFGDHYEWNKVVTCVHNVLSQQRYLEHYGEVVIRNLNSNACTCKITFVKSRYWGSDTNKNEVQGTVLDQTGSVIHRFGGLWHEGIFCDTFPTPQCVWKPNPQPKDYYLYYGFSNFALELNELTPDLKPLLPPTDSRLRPDQRMLEEGRVDDCDKFKEEVEERQRERRKQLAKRGEEHIPRFFKKAVDSCGRDVWLTNGTYWKIRENPGFANSKNLELW